MVKLSHMPPVPPISSTMETSSPSPAQLPPPSPTVAESSDSLVTLAEEGDNVTGSHGKKVTKNKRLSLSFEEEDEVKCDLDRDFSAADSILGLSNEEDPIKRLDFEPEDPLLEAIDNTIMDS